jgi:pectin methylesterase-like acyl-CoA thioesterase
MDESSSLALRRIATSAITLQVAPGESIQAAVNELMWLWDMRGRKATIKVADGVYNERVGVRGLPLGSTSRPAIVIEGNRANPSACVLDVEQGPAFENWAGM